jgi:hypothetical protein
MVNRIIVFLDEKNIYSIDAALELIKLVLDQGVNVKQV